MLGRPEPSGPETALRGSKLTSARILLSEQGFWVRGAAGQMGCASWSATHSRLRLPRSPPPGTAGQKEADNAFQPPQPIHRPSPPLSSVRAPSAALPRWPGRWPSRPARPPLGNVYLEQVHAVHGPAGLLEQLAHGLDRRKHNPLRRRSCHSGDSDERCHTHRFSATRRRHYQDLNLERYDFAGKAICLAPRAASAPRATELYNCKGRRWSTCGLSSPTTTLHAFLLQEQTLAKPVSISKPRRKRHSSGCPLTRLAPSSTQPFFLVTSRCQTLAAQPYGEATENQIVFPPSEAQREWRAANCS